MKKSLLLFAMSLLCISLLAAGASGQKRGITNTSSSPFARLKSVDIDDVRWTGGFWAERSKLCREVMVPNMWRILQDPDISHAYTNFRVAAGLEQGEFHGRWWHDGDLYKWIEAASYVYAVTKDEKLSDLLDEVIGVIAKAQRDDGYIHTSILIGHGKRTSRKSESDAIGITETPFSGKTEPFQDLSDHELYNMGHLMTAACIHHRATGKRNFLDLAVKTGDMLYKTFKSRDPRLAHFGFNPSNIMGAVELYRTTGDKKYLELAGIFVDMRGSQPGGTDLNQTRTPLREETEAVGHAVTANYLYAGAADVYAETGERALLDALERIWHNVVYQKLYVTGGCGPYHNGLSSANDHVHEAYAREYQLPNAVAYNETCANIANAMWNWRMLAITGEARFTDIMELELYNSALSGISLDGRNFFYTNPLRRTDDTPFLSWDLPTRQPYLSCFCCPPNIVRTIAKSQGWAYSLSDRGVWVNLYGANELETELLDGSKLTLTQETDYPWEGEVKIVVQSTKKKTFSLFLRIPGWTDRAVVRVNGKPLSGEIKPGAYFEIERQWAKGDRVDLEFPMPVELYTANPLVEEARNQVAVKRGPVVYCLESTDLPAGADVLEVAIPIDIEWQTRYMADFLGGVTLLEGEAIHQPLGDWDQKIYRKRAAAEKKTIPIRMIPYYAWSNRGVSEMTVWMPLNR